MKLTLVQAQRRYIERVNNCHSGHYNRVHRAAWKELCNWAAAHGFADPRAIARDADDMAKLERNSED